MTTRADLTVDSGLADFVEQELLPGLGLSPDAFWRGLSSLVSALGPRCKALLERRDALQAAIDAWYREHRDGGVDVAAEEAFLRQIGYLAPEPGPFTVSTADVDPEFSQIAGPQLVVPSTNARYALNAANARWGSLYDALYGTDAIDESGGATRGGAYNPLRGAKVIARAKAALDIAAPIAGASHADATGYAVERGALVVRTAGGDRWLADPAQFVGFCGEPAEPTAVVLRVHGLHIEIAIDRGHDVGKDDPAGVADVILSRRSPPSSTARTPSPPSTPRTRRWSTGTGSA